MKSNFTREYALFIDILINTRKSKELTQQSLAELLHKPQSFVSKYESRECRLDVVVFCEIAKALSKSPITLLQKMGFT